MRALRLSPRSPLHLYPLFLLLFLFLSADVTDAGTDSDSDSDSDSAELRTEAALKLFYAGLPDWPSSDADRTSIKSHTENTFGPDSVAAGCSEDTYGEFPAQVRRGEPTLCAVCCVLCAVCCVLLCAVC